MAQIGLDVHLCSGSPKPGPPWTAAGGRVEMGAVPQEGQPVGWEALPKSVCCNRLSDSRAVLLGALGTHTRGT